MDGIILVVEEGKTPRESVQKCAEVLKAFPLIGSVLNKVDTRTHENYYYYSYKNKEGANWKKRLQGWFKS